MMMMVMMMLLGARIAILSAVGDRRSSMAKVSDAASVYVEQCHRYKVDVNAGPLSLPLPSSMGCR